MWLHEQIKVGTPVERADNPNHTGTVVAVFGYGGIPTVRLAKASTYRVRWDNGWREDCDYDELRRVWR